MELNITKRDGQIVTFRYDATDRELVESHHWMVVRIKRYTYAARKEGKKHIYLHREINQTPAGLDTDHISGDTLDNRKCNLRTATRPENSANRKKKAGCKSRYLGVSTTRGGRWRAYIRAGRKLKHLGVFSTQEEAAKARDTAALQIHGQFARLNGVA